MKYNYHYKKLGSIEPEVLSQLKTIALAKVYRSTPDFDPNVILVAPLGGVGAPPNFVDEFLATTFPMFDQGGLVAATISKMLPQSYLMEHSDYVSIERVPSFFKLHIPIISNPLVGHMWRELRSTLHMAEGDIYVFDNLRIHSVVNLSDSPRYQLIARYKYESLTDLSILNP